jgi:hypothetical protein
MASTIALHDMLSHALVQTDLHFCLRPSYHLVIMTALLVIMTVVRRDRLSDAIMTTTS